MRGNSWVNISGGIRIRPDELSGGTEDYGYAGDSPIMFKDPLGLSYCPAFTVYKKSDYIQGQGLPPGKTIKGCAYVGYCGLAKPKFIGIYEKTDIPIGCDCPDFCLLKIDDYTGDVIGNPTCFSFPYPNSALF